MAWKRLNLHKIWSHHVKEREILNQHWKFQVLTTRHLVTMKFYIMLVLKCEQNWYAHRRLDVVNSLFPHSAPHTNAQWYVLPSTVETLLRHQSTFPSMIHVIPSLYLKFDHPGITKPFAETKKKIKTTVRIKTSKDAWFLQTLDASAGFVTNGSLVV